MSISANSCWHHHCDETDNCLLAMFLVLAVDLSLWSDFESYCLSCYCTDPNEFIYRYTEAEFILKRKRFFIALSHAHFRFEVMSILPIDRYKNTTSRVISQHRVEKSSTSKAFHARDTRFYWSSENALHERFIACSGVWVWVKTLQLIAKQ